MMMEEWRDIPGYEGRYQASDMGRVRWLGCPPSVDTRNRLWTGRPCRVKTISLSRNGYMRTMLGKGNLVPLHKILAVTFLGIGWDQIVDHKDRNPGNNSLDNLRAATAQGNSANAGISAANTSGYKGVFHKKATRRRREKWRSLIRVGGRLIHLGMYNDVVSAALAYDAAAVRYFGEFACTNKSMGLL